MSTATGDASDTDTDTENDRNLSTALVAWIARAVGPVSRQELLDHVPATDPTVDRGLSAAVDDGLLSKRRDSDDLRQVLYYYEGGLGDTTDDEPAEAFAERYGGVERGAEIAETAAAGDDSTTGDTADVDHVVDDDGEGDESDESDESEKERERISV